MPGAQSRSITGHVNDSRPVRENDRTRQQSHPCPRLHLGIVSGVRDIKIVNYAT